MLNSGKLDINGTLNPQPETTTKTHIKNCPLQIKTSFLLQDVIVSGCAASELCQLYMCVYVVYACICMYMYVGVCMCMYMYVYVGICMYMYEYVCICIWLKESEDRS